MSKYTNGEIRAAIYRAADRIERNPKLWSFAKTSIPDCGTPGCALGWIGVELGFEQRAGIFGVGVALYPELANIYTTPGNAMSKFYDAMSDIDWKWTSDAGVAAKTMRAYADKYFPAEVAAEPALDSAFVAFRESFTRSMEAA